MQEAHGYRLGAPELHVIKIPEATADLKRGLVDLGESIVGLHHDPILPDPDRRAS